MPGELQAVVLVFSGLAPPVVYAICPEEHAPTRDLLAAIEQELPAAFYGDLGIGVAGGLTGTWHRGPERLFVKMLLQDRRRIDALETADCERLGAADVAELRSFYQTRAYEPGEEHGRFFADYMPETGPYFGIRSGGELVAAGGVHVRSRRYGVAALGNIATAPQHRGQGMAGRITAAVCRELAADTGCIGLNVEADNLPAVRCYTGLGFRQVARYVEQEFARAAAG